MIIASLLLSLWAALSVSTTVCCAPICAFRGTTDNFDPKVQAAIEKIIETAHRHGKYVGFSTGDPETAVAVAKKGCDWLNIGGDVGSMISFINAMYTDIRSKL
jgi:2-keto-3-deoxy-L-rhamnonate aldolase RhmA